MQFTDVINIIISAGNGAWAAYGYMIGSEPYLIAMNIFVSILCGLTALKED